MKVAVDISQTIYRGTGVARYTLELVHALSRLKELSELVLFGFAARGWSKLNDQVGSLSSDTVTKKLFFFPPSLLQIVWNRFHIFPVDNLLGKIDLLHTSDWLEPPALVPKVTTIHDLIVLRYPELFPPALVANHRNKLHWVVKETAKIITDSENSKKDILKLLKIPETKVQVIYPGVSPQFTPQDDSSQKRVREKYHISGRFLLCVSKLEPRKNTSQLINVFKSLLQENNLTLVIAGTAGWHENRALYDHPQIKLLGFVEDDDLPALYCAADCFVYPSLYEGFGFPVLEALSCGATVVAARTGSIPEVAGNFAIYADAHSPEDLKSAITRALKKQKDKSEKIKQLTWTKKFSWKSTAAQTLNVYREVI